MITLSDFHCKSQKSFIIGASSCSDFKLSCQAPNFELKFQCLQIAVIIIALITLTMITISGVHSNYRCRLLFLHRLRTIMSSSKFWIVNHKRADLLRQWHRLVAGWNRHCLCFHCNCLPNGSLDRFLFLQEKI